MILEADSILSSSLSLWWLALGNRKIIEQNGLVCYCARSYTDSGPKVSSGPEEGRGRRTGCSADSSLSLCSFPRNHLTVPGPPLNSWAQHSSWFRSSSEIKLLEWHGGQQGQHSVLSGPDNDFLSVPWTRLACSCLRRMHLLSASGLEHICPQIFAQPSSSSSLLRCPSSEWLLWPPPNTVPALPLLFSP